MMDAGVPLKAPVAGVAMGLILEDDGDTRSCPTSWVTKTTWATWTSKWRVPKQASRRLQMDIKIAGITPEIMEKALAQAKDGRLHILGEMNKALTGARILGITHRASKRCRSQRTKSVK